MLEAPASPDSKSGRLLGISQQELEFSLWYMRQRSWITVLDTGQYAITVDGIDKLGSKELSLPSDRLLPSSSLGEREPIPVPHSELAAHVAR